MGVKSFVNDWTRGSLLGSGHISHYSLPSGVSSLLGGQGEAEASYSREAMALFMCFFAPDSVLFDDGGLSH